MPETKLEPRAGQPQQQSHGLALRDRRHLAVTGVSRVISCDESAAVLETPLGNLTIGGQELQIGELSTQSGQVQISGRIEYLQYAENQQSGGGLLARLLPLDGPVTRPVGGAGGCAVVPWAGLPAGGARMPVRLALGEGALRCLFPGYSGLCCGGGAGAAASLPGPVRAV